MKIFGEEHFIDNTMCEIIEDYNNKVDKVFFDEMTKTLKYTMPEVKVDEKKLRKWVVLCMKLENIDYSDLIDIAIKKKFAEKDQRIKELEEENKNKSQLGFALYMALVKELEKRGLTDDIPSVIDQLVGKNCGEYADMYNEYKNQQKELAIYKKALELACESVVKHEKRVDEEMGIIAFFGETFDYDVNEFVEHYLQQAKEKINEKK